MRGAVNSWLALWLSSWVVISLNLAQASSALLGFKFPGWKRVTVGKRAKGALESLLGGIFSREYQLNRSLIIDSNPFSRIL